jgi:hypothetical protein
MGKLPIAAMTEDMKTPMPPAASGPTASGKRFLAQLMEHAFREGWRTPDDFFKHFPAHAIMSALKSAPDLRVAILAAATGIYEEILRRKTPALAAEDLRLALDEGTTSSMQLLSVFSAEDRVRYLDPHRIWDFLAEDRFWQLEADASDELRRGAIERMTFTLTHALQERLLTLRDILDGLTYEAVADSLSPHELRSVVRYALVKGREGIGLNEKVLLEVLPLEKLVRSVPLEHIWHEVVVRRLAVPSGLTDLSREERRTSQAERQGPAESQRWSSRPPPAPPALPGGRADAAPLEAYPQFPSTGADYAGAEYGAEHEVLTEILPAAVAGRESSLLPPPLHPNAATAEYEPAGYAGARPGFAGPPLSDDFNQPLAQHTFPTQPSPSMPRQPAAGQPFDASESDAAERQRQRVTEHLRAIGRLPPRHAQMPAAVLRSIDAMYALLPAATDDIQRKSVMRQAFANEHYLRAALLGLIELMDSSVDTSDPVIQEAKIEALIKILLFEEQRRKETGRFPVGAFSAQRGVSSSIPSESFSPGSFPPGSFPPPSYPSGSFPPGSYPPGSFSPGSYPPASVRPSSTPSGFGQRPSEGFYYPQQPAAPGYGNDLSRPPHVATQRPPPPVLNGAPGYPGSTGPLPNLPAEAPQSSRRRTMPPPLPPSYPRS